MASLAAGLTTAGGTLLAGGARVLADAGLGNIKALREWQRDLSVQLRSGDATSQQLTIFNARAGFLGDRLRNAFELLDRLHDSR